MIRFRIFHAVVLLFALTGAERMAIANENTLSTNTTGMIGLNTVPTARMDQAGTMRAGISTLDPHNHAFIGLQVAKPLYVNLRQSMYITSAGQKPDFVYPGMDIKLRLKEEGRYMPEIAFGMDAPLGHQRFSSEYFALSKRWYDFDFTAGIAWGRQGSAGHIKNPLATLSSHFDRERNFGSEDATTPSDWFTGKEIGFFGGVEYFTPIQGLSLKADIGANDYVSEKAQIADFNKPAPWSLGFNYSPKDWVSLGASVIGFDKVMARVSFQGNIFDWGGKSHKDNPAPAGDGMFDKVWGYIQRGMDAPEKINFGKIRTVKQDLRAIIHINDYQPTAMQIGQAAHELLKDAKPNIQTITVIPVGSGLRGQAITLSRRDLEQAFIKNTGSPEELWQDAVFANDKRSITKKTGTHKFKLIPEIGFSIEEETTHLYRTSLIGEQRKEWKHGFVTGSSVRLNIKDNLHRLSKFRDTSDGTIRGNARSFAKNRLNVERTYASWMKTILPDLHFAATAGYLEEMFMGYGGEILYRPFGSPFAIGAEAWNVYKRDPETAMALGVMEGSHFTGHLNLYYDIPDTDITTFIKAGEFIGGDVGLSGGAQMRLENGMKIKGIVTATDDPEKDFFGGDKNVYAGLQVSLPLGDLKFLPQGSEARMKIMPIGRNDAQEIDKPESLYDITEPMSYRHLGRNWQAVQK